MHSCSNNNERQIHVVEMLKVCGNIGPVLCEHLFSPGENKSIYFGEKSLKIILDLRLVNSCKMEPYI